MKVTQVTPQFSSNHSNVSNNYSKNTHLNNNIGYDSFSSQNLVSFKGDSRLSLLNRIFRIFHKESIPESVVIIEEQKQARTAHNLAKKAFAKVRKQISDAGTDKLAKELASNPKALPEPFQVLGINSPVLPWRKSSEDIKQHIKPSIIKGLIATKDKIHVKSEMLAKYGLVKDPEEFANSLIQYSEASQTAKNLSKKAKNIKDHAMALTPEFKTAQEKYQQAILNSKKAEEALNMAYKTNADNNKLHILKDKRDIAKFNKILALAELKDTANDYKMAINIARIYTK